MMNSKAVSLVLAYMIRSLAFNITSKPVQAPRGFNSQESQVIALVDGTSAYNYSLKLEEIALNHNVLEYSFRARGSVEASETANWIEAQFEGFGRARLAP